MQLSIMGRPSSWTIAAHAIVVVGLASLLACTPAKLSKDKTLQFDPNLMRSPPEVADVSMQVLVTPTDEGNARLRVRFREKIERRSLLIQGGRGPTLLRDDGAGADERGGDGVFSAFVHFDAADYEAELKRRAELVRKVHEVPVFKNRALVGKKRQEVPKMMRFVPGQTFQILQFDGDPATVDWTKSLVITHATVVEDKTRTYNPCITGTEAGAEMGAWTFGKLMTELANEAVTGINPSDFTLHWLQEWASNQVINNFAVTNRSAGLDAVILNPWPRLPDGSGRLDLAKAPFQLLAIVNRIDLRGSRAYGSGDAGEARLVFQLIQCKPPPSQDPDFKDFLVIFEYGIKKSSCSEVRDWAQQWLDLSSSSLVLGSSEYNAALQAITDQFTLSDADPSKLPNRSALNQLRSNEFAIAGGGFAGESEWELREFKLCDDPAKCDDGQLDFGRFEQTTVAQTPDISFQGFGVNRTLLGDFMNANQAAILAGTHEVPEKLESGVAIRAGAIQPGAGVVTNPGEVDQEARHVFSLATCNGCHMGERVARFTHISKPDADSPTVLSGFLTGITVTDPVSGVSRTFHDLLDRQVKLASAADMFCGRRELRDKKPPTSSKPRAAERRESFPVDELFPRFVPRSFPH